RPVVIRSAQHSRFFDTTRDLDLFGNSGWAARDLTIISYRFGSGRFIACFLADAVQTLIEERANRKETVCGSALAEWVVDPGGKEAFLRMRRSSADSSMSYSLSRSEYERFLGLIDVRPRARSRAPG